MKFYTRAVLLASIVLLFSVAAEAQTSYSTDTFSAMFNGEVQVKGPVRNNEGSSTHTLYWSGNSGVLNLLWVRSVDHDIQVSSATAEWYARDNGQGDTLVGNITTGSYQGHPYAYANYEYVDKVGATKWRRTRYIILNNRTVIWICFSSKKEDTDDAAVEKFFNSLNIK